MGKETITFPADTGGSAYDSTNPNSAGIEFNFWLAAGSAFTSGTLATTWTGNDDPQRVAGITVNVGDSGYWQITGLQIEIGSVATDFEHRSFAQELALCERYFQIVVDGSETSNQYFATTFNYTSGDSYGTFTYRTTMRTTPSLVQTSGSNYYYFYGNLAGQGFSSFAGLSHPGRRSTGIYATGLSLNQGGAGGFTSQNSSAKVSMNAEL